MNKLSTKKATRPRKIEDLAVKDTGHVVGGQSNPNENISVNFAKIEYAYKL